MKIVAALRDRVRLAGLLTFDEDRLADQARAERDAALQTRLAERPVVPLADPMAQRRAAQRFGEDLQAEIERRQRAAAQAVEVAAEGSARDRAGLAGRFEIENQVADRQAAVFRDLADARRELAASAEFIAVAEAHLAEATDAGKDAAVDALVAARQRHADAQTGVADADALAAATDALVGSYERFASAAEDVARAATLNPFQQLQREIKTLDEGLLEVGANGLRNFGDELARVVETGKLDFQSLANSIISDLVRVLIQTQITANLLRVIGVAFPGLGLNVGGVEAHEGGIAGRLTQRHTGPLKADEVVGVLRRKEEVLTEFDPRHRDNIARHSLVNLRAFVSRLPRFHEGGVVGGGRGGGASGMGLTVEIINRSRAPIEIQQGDQRSDVRGLVQRIIIDDTRINGPITKTLALAGRR